MSGGAWNTAKSKGYRVIRHSDGYLEWLSIHMVYFDTNGNPVAMDMAVAGVSGESREELLADYQSMADAFNHKVLSAALFDRDTMRRG